MSARINCILSFESSCDESSIAVVSEKGEILFQNLSSQIDIHKKYGGVVPEVASRAHSEVMPGLLKEALDFLESRSDLHLEKVAVTRGPGLIGPLMVASSCAEGLGLALGKEVVGVHHLRGHLASVLLSDEKSGKLVERAQLVFPAWVVLVSGGHTQVLFCDERLNAEILATTADDAAGECFDKSAKLMGLPYPGGPQIEARASQLEEADLKLAKKWSSELPRPRSATGFSFSGLKTAIRLKLSELSQEEKDSPAFAWAIQDAICKTLIQGMERTLKSSEGIQKSSKVIFCGGVSANKYIRSELFAWASKRGLELILPPLKYCTDNGAMIGAAAWVQSDELKIDECKARIPLAPTSFVKGKQPADSRRKD